MKRPPATGDLNSYLRGREDLAASTTTAASFQISLGLLTSKKSMQSLDGLHHSLDGRKDRKSHDSVQRYLGQIFSICPHSKTRQRSFLTYAYFPARGIQCIPDRQRKTPLRDSPEFIA